MACLSSIKGYQAHHQALLGGNYSQLAAINAAAAEPAFVQEKAKEYGKRLQKAAHAIFLKHSAELQAYASAALGGLDARTAEVEKAKLDQVISDNDAMLITEIASRAQDAVIDYKIELLNDQLVIPLDSSDLLVDPQVIAATSGDNLMR